MAILRNPAAPLARRRSFPELMRSCGSMPGASYKAGAAFPDRGRDACGRNGGSMPGSLPPPGCHSVAMALIRAVKGRESLMKLSLTKLSLTTSIRFLILCLPATLPASACAQDITAMISQYRREHGLPAVKVDPKLTAVAERQAQAMARSGIMDHNVDGSFASRVAGAGLAGSAENIAAGTRTWDDTLRMWKESPGHNRNLLLSGADVVGVAVARNEATHYKVYWAMVIGRRGDGKRKPATATAAAAEKPGTAVEGPTFEQVQSSVSEWFNGAVTSMKNLLQ
jgi:uncharacterized protein YkwD